MAKQTKSKPNKNSDGQPKQPSANPTGGPSAAPPQAPPEQGAPPPGQAPSLVPPGGPPDPQQIQMQSAARAAGAFQPQPPGALGARSDERTQINFKDLPPLGQAQAQEQAGINPAAPLQMMQGQLASSMQEPGGPQQPQQGPVPASFSGPMTPPGLENFPHDYASLMQVMARGYSPGASNAEHQMAMNAHSMVRMGEQHAQNMSAQQDQQGQVAQALGGLVQQLGANGQIPHPDAVAAAAADAQRRKAMGQLQSSY